jgi:hypothetical protein
MTTGPDSVTYSQTIGEVGGPADAVSWQSTARPALPLAGMYGYAADLDDWEFRVGSSWLHAAWLDKTTAQTFAGRVALGAGMSWNVGGSFAAGNLARDVNWGLWLQGASGAAADVALATSGGTAAVKIPSTGYVQMDKGVYAGGNAANTWSGTSLLPPNLALASLRTFNGTLPVGQSSDNGAHLNWVKATDNMVVGTSGVSAISHFAVNGTMGATATGNRVAHNVTLALTTLTASKAAGLDPNYNAGSYYVYSTANQGGTAQTVAGANSSLFGDIKIVRTGSAATYFRDLVGLEIDMISETASGTAPLRKVGIQVVGYNDGTLVDTSQGAFIDAGLLFAQSTTGSVPGWRHGILFGQNNSGLGLSATGTALMFQAKAPSGSVPTLNTTGYGVDGLQATWASAFLRSKQFSVGPDGTVQVYSGYVAPTANGISIAASGRVGTAEAGTLAMGGTSTGGTGWVSNEMVFDTQGLGFVGYVSGVSAGAVTQITVLRQAIQNGAAPTNPVALTGRAGSLGAGLAADMTWTVKSELSLQPTAGQTILMSALQASTTYANDAAAAAGGVAVGQLYRNGSVVQCRIV